VSILDGSRIGARVIIHAGSVIGADGFGFASDGKEHHKLLHTGIVQIDDDVEIGACNTIDRAKFGRTWIQRGVKTDNLVHIAHNVVIGERSLVIAHAGVAGSAKIGAWVVLAGQVGVAPHVTIGDGAVIAPQSAVPKDVAPGEVLTGTPAIPHRTFLKMQRMLPKVPDMAKQLADLKRRVAALEDGRASTPESNAEARKTESE
jgi:UDP-3-O-[3-hydroxymyristoyl] glucosamine N-acyltransferase